MGAGCARQGASDEGRRSLFARRRRPYGRAVAAIGTEAIAPDVERPFVDTRRMLAAVLRGAAVCVRLLATRRLAQPRRHVGEQVRFRDGTRATIYRETVMRGRSPASPTTLVVEFRLRWVHGRGHALFRLESILNTPMFAGFDGFVSKLWLAHDEREVYRGIYDWDGPELAHDYATALGRLLAFVCVPGSVHYAVLRGIRRDDYVASLGMPAPEPLSRSGADAPGALRRRRHR